MFCTDKERETCEVEKQGCEGCYYNNDENVVNQMQEFVDWIKANRDKAVKPDELIAILQGMLDLYNKREQELQQEKEKNKKYQTIAVSLSKGDAYFNGMLVFDTSKFTNKIEEQFKVIDMMAEDLYRYRYDDQLDTGKSVDFDCVKEYYFKKARGGK